MKKKLHVEVIFVIWKISHLDSFWNRGSSELGNIAYSKFIATGTSYGNSCYWNYAYGEMLLEKTCKRGERNNKRQNSDPLASFVCQTAVNCDKSYLQHQRSNLMSVFFVYHAFGSLMVELLRLQRPYLLGKCFDQRTLTVPSTVVWMFRFREDKGLRHGRVQVRRRKPLDKGQVYLVSV